MACRLLLRSRAAQCWSRCISGKSSVSQSFQPPRTVVALFSSSNAAAATKEDEQQEEKELSFHSPKVKDLYDRMIQLSPEELGMVGELTMEKLGIEIVPIEAGAAVAEAEEGAQDEEGAAAVEEKTAFDLKLTAFDAKAKIKVIKEVRAIGGFGLKEAKELVEGAPKTVKKGIKREEAEELKAKLEEVGGTVEIV